MGWRAVEEKGNVDLRGIYLEWKNEEMYRFESLLVWLEGEPYLEAKLDLEDDSGKR